MSKIYIEARFQMPVLDTDEFGYDKEEAEKINWEEFAKDDFWNSCEDMGELENKYDFTFHKVQPKLSIPKKIAEELEELTGKTNWESTPYSVIEEKGKINTWAYLGHGKCSEHLYKFCRDNTRLMHAYLNPLTRPFVEVTDE